MREISELEIIGKSVRFTGNMRIENLVQYGCLISLYSYNWLAEGRQMV